MTRLEITSDRIAQPSEERDAEGKRERKRKILTATKERRRGPRNAAKPARNDRPAVRRESERRSHQGSVRASIFGIVSGTDDSGEGATFVWPVRNAIFFIVIKREPFLSLRSEYRNGHGRSGRIVECCSTGRDRAISKAPRIGARMIRRARARALVLVKKRQDFYFIPTRVV